MVCGQDAGLGRDRDVFSNAETTAVVEPASFVDRAVSSDTETAARIELRTAENAAAVADFKPHDVAIKCEAHRVTRNIRDQAITNEEESIEPDPAKKRTRSHIMCATDVSESVAAMLPAAGRVMAFQNFAR